jgi:predicted negative regulator of RcsB-dependent stress response
MAYDLQEQEHIDAFKAWWKKYGVILSALVLLGGGAYGAVKFQAYRQQQQAAKASTVYDAIKTAILKKDSKQLSVQFKLLSDEYAKTAYAAMGGELAAKGFRDMGDDLSAEKALRWVLENTDEVAFQMSARLKLVSVLIDNKKMDEAAKLLEINDPPAAYLADIAEAKGDVLFAQNKPDLAKAEYNKAQTIITQLRDMARAEHIQQKIMAIGLN